MNIHVAICLWLDAGKPVGPIKKIITEEMLFQVIYDEYGFSKEILVQQNRKFEVKHARQMFCFIAYKKAEMTYAKIGKIIKRDHSSVIHGCKAIQDEIDTDYKTTKEEISRI